MGPQAVGAVAQGRMGHLGVSKVILAFGICRASE